MPGLFSALRVTPGTAATSCEMVLRISIGAGKWRLG